MNKKHFIIIVTSLVLFAVISGLVTYGMIHSTINKKIEAIQSGDMSISSGEEENEVVKPSLGIDVNGTFDENSIEWIEQAYQEGQTEIKYYKISGLVNKEVENKINNKLKEAAFKKFDPNKIEQIRLEVYQSINASFANVISVRTSISTSNIDGRSNYKYENINVNVELVNGEKIRFKDLFVDENAMFQLMYAEFYEDEAWKKQWEKETDPFDGGYTFNEELWDAPILNIDEDAIIKKINRYKKADIDSFVFSTKYVSADILLDSGDTEYLYLQFDKIPAAIALYDRYLTDDRIYENELLGRKNIINLSHLFVEPNACYLAYENDKTTNFFADVQVYSDMYDVDYEIEEKAKEYIVKIAQKELVEFERMAQSEPDKYFVFCRMLRLYDAPGNAFSVSTNVSDYYTDISKKDDLYKVIADAYTDVDFETYGAGNIYINLEKEENSYISGERYWEDTYYSLKTFTPIKTVEDLFFEGYDYETILKNEFGKLWLLKTGELIAGEELDEQYSLTDFEYATKWISGNGESGVIEIYNKTLGFYQSEYNDNFRSTEIYLPLTIFNQEDLTI